MQLLKFIYKTSLQKILDKMIKYSASKQSQSKSSKRKFPSTKLKDLNFEVQANENLNDFNININLSKTNRKRNAYDQANVCSESNKKMGDFQDVFQQFEIPEKKEEIEWPEIKFRVKLDPKFQLTNQQRFDSQIACQSNRISSGKCNFELNIRMSNSVKKLIASSANSLGEEGEFQRELSIMNCEEDVLLGICTNQLIEQGINSFKNEEDSKISFQEGLGLTYLWKNERIIGGFYRINKQKIMKKKQKVTIGAEITKNQVRVIVQYAGQFMSRPIKLQTGFWHFAVILHDGNEPKNTKIFFD